MADCPFPQPAASDDECGGLGGLPGCCPCPKCIALYHQVTGTANVPVCMVCGGRHWAYEPHLEGAIDGKESGRTNYKQRHL